MVGCFALSWFPMQHLPRTPTAGDMAQRERPDLAYSQIKPPPSEIRPLDFYRKISAKSGTKARITRTAGEGGAAMSKERSGVAHEAERRRLFSRCSVYLQAKFQIRLLLPGSLAKLMPRLVKSRLTRPKPPLGYLAGCYLEAKAISSSF